MVSWDGIFLWAFIMNTLKLWGARSLSLQRLVQRLQSLLVTSVIAGEKFTEHEKVMWMLSIFPEKSISHFLMALPPVLISSKEKKKKTLKSDPEWRRFSVVTAHCHCKGSGVAHLSLEMELNQIKCFHWKAYIDLVTIC